MRTKDKPVKSERTEDQKRQAMLAAVASKHAAFRPARAVLKRVRAVPTIFPGVDEAGRVGGFPIERVVTVHGPSNHGKAQPVDEPVLTPNGWKPIGELQVGDVVVGSDGMPTEVTGVFPQGRRDVFKVSIDDGCETRCCSEHLWLTTTAKELNQGRYVRGPRPERERISTGEVGSGSVKSLAEIMATLDSEHYLPFVGTVQFVALPTLLPMDPYYLGLLLGDGCFRMSSITVTTEDDDLMAAVEDAAATIGDTVVRYESEDRCPGVRITGGPKGTRNGSETKRRIEAMGLWFLKSDAKFVPSDYIRASSAQRLALLQGLMDTDGHCAGTQAQYSSTSPALRDAVVDIVRSLGGRALVYEKTNHPTPETRAWIVMISFVDSTCPFRLYRKASEWKVRRKVLRRRIVAVEKAGAEECVCIRVAAEDHLYVTKDYILTHNTLWTIGVGLSFLMRGHFFKLFDAERTTTITWMEHLMGEYADHPGFSATRPATYEAAVSDLREWATAIGNAKAKGQLPADVTGIAVVDSMRKLVPRGFFEKVGALGADGEAKKKGSRVNPKTVGVDGFGGRGAQIKAALNAAWLDEIIPLIDDMGVGVALITRETDDPDADQWDKKAGRDFKIGGGKAMVYEASLLARVSRDGFVWGPGPEGERKPVYGERHKVTLHKTKIAGKDEREQVGYFHSSNGTFTPEGFDRARDLVKLGIKHEIIHASGSWLAWNRRKWQGEHSAVKALAGDADGMAMLEEAVRSHFDLDDKSEVAS